MTEKFNRDAETGNVHGPTTGSRPTAHVDDVPWHYLHTAPSPVPGIAGLLVALALLAFGISEVRTGVTKQTSLTVAAAGATATEGTPVLQVTAESWSLAGQPLEENDVLFRLSGAADRSQVIIVEHAIGLSAERLTRALEMINQAGFSQVGIRTMETDKK